MYPIQLTSQGQITLPAAARRLVGFGPGDRLLVTPFGDKLEISKDFGVNSLQGIFAKYAVDKPPLSKAKMDKIRDDLYTGRYKKWLKQ